jgi:hypothetical protein
MKNPLNKEQLASLEVGDIVERALAGLVLLETRIVSISDTLITVEPNETLEKVTADVKKGAEIVGHEAPQSVEMPTWTFSKETGGEIDEDLGWDGKRTGSYLCAILKKHNHGQA